MTDGGTSITLLLPPDLEAIRREIEEIDGAIVDRLVRRAELARRAAEVKREHGLPPLDEDRERRLRLLWTAQANMTLLSLDRAPSTAFWADLAAVFDCVLDFCSRPRR